VTRILVLCLLVATATAGKRDWTGTPACGACHPKELAAWQATPHANTRARFEGRPQATCLACHGTGDAPAGVAIAVEVGCEACHGAGAAYGSDDVMRDRPVALALGMRDLSTPALRAKLCAECHAATTMRGTSFDPSRKVHE
jgi:nitrate/TMAO reductase-like tetraheme cytochrome c subunit